MVTFHGHGFTFVIPGVKAAVRIFYGYTFFEHNTLHFAVLCENFLWSPSTVNGYLFFLCFLNFFFGCRHHLPTLQTVHGNAVCTAAHTGSCHINGYVSAAYNYRFAGNRIGIIFACSPQEIHRCHHSVCVLSRYTRQPSALTANSNVKCLIPLCAKFVQSNIPSHFYTGSDFYAHFFDNINFCLHHVFFQLERRNSIDQHTAGFLILLKNGRLITFFSQIERTG